MYSNLVIISQKIYSFYIAKPKQGVLPCLRPLDTGIEDATLLEAATEQRDWEHSQCVTMISEEWLTSCVFNSSVKTIINPNLVYSNSYMWQYNLLHTCGTIQFTWEICAKYVTEYL